MTKDRPFHNPFTAAKDKLAKLVPAAAARPEPAPPTVTATPTNTVTASDTDTDLFDREMHGVAPLAPDPRGRVGAEASPPRPRTPGDEAEAYAELADLVDGAGPFDISDTDEFIEGIAPGLDRRILKRLRKGDYALQGHLDLHGLTRDQAKEHVERFLADSRAAGKRCVLLIHGRGLGSKDQIPVLKEQLRVWLERGRIAKGVLAFTSARPCDGGTGAVYVLLRR